MSRKIVVSCNLKITEQTFFIICWNPKVSDAASRSNIGELVDRALHAK
jgi:hypothetical protein